MSDALSSRVRRPTIRIILSLFLPRLSIDRLRRWGLGETAGTPPERGVPLVVVKKLKNALRIVAADPIAEWCGIRSGMSLAHARGAVPDMHVVEADATADLALLEKIADWCDRYTPLVTLDPPDGLFLDISGCAHLFARKDDNGEAALLADCLNRLADQGFAAVGAVASTAGAAWAVAHYGEGGVVAAGEETVALAALPVAALKIPPEDEALLDRLGLKRIGQLYDKPKVPLTARFGAHLVTRLDQVLGHLDEPLAPRRPTPQLSAERRFVEPVSEEPFLLQTVRSLAEALQPALARHDLGARLVEAAFFRVDGAVARVSVGTAAPVRAADTLAMLFSERLSGLRCEWEAGEGFDMIRLSVLSAEPLSAAQIDLAGRARNDADLRQLVDRLSARLGPSRVTRFVAVDTHIPESAVSASPLSAPAAAAPGWMLPQAHAETPPDRPVRLFSRPEPVDVLAEVPEGPPLRFRWRRALYDVARAEGPERIAPEWWRLEDAASETRDYYRVEDTVGRRFWLFREGLYGRESRSPAWYMHGLFA